MIAMITNKQMAFLQKMSRGEQLDRRVYSIYMRRIQKKLDEGMERLVWLAENYPWILSDIDSELEDSTLPRYRRLKALIKVLSLIASDRQVIVELRKENEQRKEE